MRPRVLPSLLIALLPGVVLGQLPLSPTWVHTWPFGSDTVPYHIYTQSSGDNHLAVDPITGHVYVTIDDQQQLASPRFNFLFSFDPGHLALIAIIIVCQGAAEIAVARNYGVALLFFSPLAIGMSNLSRGAPWQPLLVDRLAEAALGTVVAFLAIVVGRRIHKIA